MVYGSSGLVGFHNIGLVEGPGIIVGRKGNVGSVYWSDKEFYPIDTTYYVTSKLPLIYCYFLLKNQLFVNSDSVVPGLNREQAYSIKVSVPNKDLLRKFNILVLKFRAKIRSLEEENDYLEDIRNSLLRRLVSGEINL